MDKQFSIYSINFRAFYTDEEMEISNKILKMTMFALYAEN